MKPPPSPLNPSGLSDSCQDIIGERLYISCVPGWGWTEMKNGELECMGIDSLQYSLVAVVPQSYVEFRGSSRCGFFGRVVEAPEEFPFDNVLAFIMSDGCDYDLSDNIAPHWRVIFGDGQPDFESSWFPTLHGEPAILGYGAVGESREHLVARGLVFAMPTALTSRPQL